jgi:hypothetical protein
MPALGGIIAKILVLVENVLDEFVYLDTYTLNEECGITAFNATATACGDELATQISQLLFSAMAMLNDVMAALTANVY